MTPSPATAVDQSSYSPRSPTYVRESSPVRTWATDTSAASPTRAALNDSSAFANDRTFELDAWRGQDHGMDVVTVTSSEASSPTYSYVSPPYEAPPICIIDSDCPPSPTYAPQRSQPLVYSGPCAHVEWFQSKSDISSHSLEMLLSCVHKEKIEMCDCLKDPRASPTGNYDMLASRDLAKSIKELKCFYDDKDRKDMWDSTQRSNKWELTGQKDNHIFMNRHAVKMAELDWLFNLTSRTFSNPPSAQPSKHDRLLYFADVCGGPGGFTEFIYWRRQKAARGWGFTLKGEQDLRIDKFNATSPAYNFRPLYGLQKDGGPSNGDVTSNDNMRNFAATVEADTEGRGVMLVTSDGDADEGGEYLKQEWNMRRLILCQAALALLVLREGGNLVLKIFDVFTPFMHDLLFLVSSLFRKCTIVKPLTSRPASSERYFVCLGLLQRRPTVADFLLEVNLDLDTGPEAMLRRRGQEVVRLLSPENIPNSWTNYVRECNIRVGMAQEESLREAIEFFWEPERSIRPLQNDLSAELLACWGVPKNIPASRDFLKSGKTMWASVLAADRVLFRFDPDKDAPTITSNRSAKAENSLATVNSNESTMSRTADQSAGDAEGVVPNHVSIGRSTDEADRVERLKESDAQSAALSKPQPKEKSGPDLLDKKIQAALEERAARARLDGEEKQASSQALQNKSGVPNLNPGAVVSGKQKDNPLKSKGKDSADAARVVSRKDDSAARSPSSKEDQGEDEELLRRERKEAKRQRKQEAAAAAITTAPSQKELDPLTAEASKLEVRFKMPSAGPK